MLAWKAHCGLSKSRRPGYRYLTTCTPGHTHPRVAAQCNGFHPALQRPQVSFPLPRPSRGHDLQPHLLHSLCWPSWSHRTERWPAHMPSVFDSSRQSRRCCHHQPEPHRRLQDEHSQRPQSYNYHGMRGPWPGLLGVPDGPGNVGVEEGVGR